MLSGFRVQTRPGSMNMWIHLPENLRLRKTVGRMATYSGKVVTWDEAINSQVVLGTDAESFNAPAPIQPGDGNNYPVPIPGSEGIL